MNEVQAIQGTVEWLLERKGKWTSSNLDCLMVKGKDASTLGAGAISLCYEKLAERLSTEVREVSSQFMDWGNEHEDDARELFQKVTGLVVEEVGFIPYPCQLNGLVSPDDVNLSKISGGSPDGVINSVGSTYDCVGKRVCTVEKAVIEIKCPHDPANHLYTLIHKDIPKKNKTKYMIQMQWNMYCTGAQKAYFISYDPRMEKDEHKLVYFEVERDEEMIGKIKERILVAEKYLRELEVKIGL